MGGSDHLAVAIDSHSLATTYPVQVHIPMAHVKKITRHRLSGDPRQTNLDAMNINIQDEDVPLTDFKDGVLSYSVPPGSITIFDFE